MKTKVTKRILATIMTVVMLLSAIPFGGLVGFDLFTKASAEDMYANILSIDIEPVKLIENYDGYYTIDYIYNEETYDFDESDEYFCYHANPDKFTVNYKDGTSCFYSEYEINELFNVISYNDNQSYNNQWVVGSSNSFTYDFDGLFSSELIVEIVESPVKDIEIIVNKTEYVENVDGYITYDYDYEGNIQKNYFCYDLDYEINIDYIDGFNYDDWAYSVEDNQSSDTPWGVGKHVVTVSAYGFKKSFEVEVIENPYPILNATVISTKTLLENTDGYISTCSYYDEEIREYIKDSWFNYYIYNLEPIIKLDFVDGTSFEGTESEIYSKYGYYIQINDTQSYENQWSIGKHELYLNIGIISVKFEVEVIESPITKIEIIKAPDKTTYSVGEYVDFKGMVVRVFYNTNEYTDISFDGSCYSYKSYYDQMLNRTFLIGTENIINEIGTHSIEFNYCGQKDSFTVIGKENKTKEISIENNEKRQLVITFTDEGGNTKKATVLDFNARAGDITDGLYFNESGLLFTDIGVFNATIMRDNDGKASVIFTDLSTDKDLVSNKLTKCYWIDSYSYSKNIFSYLYFEIIEKYNYNKFELAQINIDDIILFSLNLCKEDLSYDVMGDKISYSIEDVLKSVYSVFAIDDIDLTESSFYDSTTNKIIIIEGCSGGDYSILKSKWYYEDGYYIYERTTYNFNSSTVTIKIIFNEDYKIVNFSITNGLNEDEDLIKGVSLSSKDMTTNYNRTFTLTPTVEVEGEPEYTVEYTSSNPKVATVDNDGNVKTTGKGNATITVTVTDSDGNVFTDTCNVNVETAEKVV